MSTKDIHGQGGFPKVTQVLHRANFNSDSMLIRKSLPYIWIKFLPAKDLT